VEQVSKPKLDRFTRYAGTAKKISTVGLNLNYESSNRDTTQEALAEWRAFLFCAEEKFCRRARGI
jgi:hypothetical protein